ncbi:MAG: hypothetical protein ACSLFP_11955, partial [Acidimicrobiales bacterium]
ITLHSRGGRMRQDQPGTLDRRALLRRMAVGGAALWAAPSFHSVASAQSSPSGEVCLPGLAGVLDWNDQPLGQVFDSAVIDGVTVSVGAVAAPGTTLIDNRTVTQGPSGSLNQPYLRLEMVPNAVGRSQTITIAFSPAVSSVSFLVTDIDNVSGSWSDRLTILTPGFGYSIPTGSRVTGNGTPGDRFRNRRNNENVSDFSNDGNLLLSHPGPISSFSMLYENGPIAGGGNQYIGFSAISWVC